MEQLNGNKSSFTRFIFLQKLPFLKNLRPVRSCKICYNLNIKITFIKLQGRKNMQDFGKIIFKIDQVLEVKNISKNKLEKEANLQRTQLNSYCNNKVKRIDLETIAKICYVLECKVEDIMEYVR